MSQDDQAPVSRGGRGLAAERAPALWLCDLAAAAAPLDRLDQHIGLLSAKTGGSPHTSSEQKRRAHIALRALLAGLVGVDRARQPFEISAAGKPRLAAPQHVAAVVGSVAFSLAHCDDYALIGLSLGGDIGVDLELRRGIRIGPERRALLEAAAVRLAKGVALPAGDGDGRFLQAWVRLEAVAKATGEGISTLLGRVGARGRLAAPVAGDNGANAGFDAIDIKLPETLDAFAAAAFHGAADAGAGAKLQKLPFDFESLERLAAGRWSPMSATCPLAAGRS
ncbi:MAG: hypothetical protein R3D67_04265 [Hyphomicrobiaceae bacterium]